MTPSPWSWTSPRRGARRWISPLAAVVATTALGVSLLAVPAYADGELPAEQSSAPDTATEPPAGPAAETPGPATETAGPATETASPATETAAEDPANAPATEASEDEPAPTDEPQGRPGTGAGPVVELAPALQCNTVYALQGAGTRNIWSVDTASGALTSAGTFSISGNTNNLNGLGVSADGQKVYGVIPNSSGSGRTVYLHDRASGATTSLGAGVASAVTTHGAVNPANGFYYYGGVTSGTLNIYGFNTTANTSLGLVASGPIPNGGGNGDWAFDTKGSLYVVAGDAGDNRLSVVNQAIPTTSQTTPVAISGTLLATSTVNAAINGIAYGGDGYLYIASNARIYKINPSSGASVSDAALSTTGQSVDLASCAVPSTLEVVKDFPDGRTGPLDQATLSIEGGGLSAAVTASTAGADAGLQDDPAETAGPVLALNGTTYAVSESGLGAGASYVKSWKCVNTTTGTTLAQGTGVSGTVTVPAGTATAVVLCTFTNGVPKKDYGDAPASFTTTQAQNGPSHTLVGYDATTRTAPLMLGGSVDHDADGVPGAAADGDDTTGTDDETALPSLSLAPGATTATGTVPLVNTSGAAATLYGFIDTNGNGTFQTSEATTVAVPNGATSATLSWTGLPAATAGSTPTVRLRLTSSALADIGATLNFDDRSQGPAADGEVEDSLATVSPWTDFGDAPASYGTLSANNGARHLLAGYNQGGNTASPMLGVKVDGDADGAPGSPAAGDDTAGIDDEDGVAFNTDVTAAGRLETVFVTASAAGFLSGWIDYDRDGDFDTAERIFADTPVSTGVNRLTYTVPTGAGFVAGASYARFRITSAAGQVTGPTGPAPDGEVEDYARTLFDPEAAALQQCPVGSQPQAVSIIQNPSFETRTGTFANSGSGRTINFAQNWWDSHPTGGQYFLFRPDFDSGPSDTTAWPWRAGADGYGFLGGHTSPGRDEAGTTNDAGEGAVNTLTAPLAGGTTYVGFFSIGAGSNTRTGTGYMRFFGVDHKDVGSIPTTAVVNPSATNRERLFDTGTVSPAAAGQLPQWKQQTFVLNPTRSWPFLRVEARNSNPAANGSAAGQAWLMFDDFHLFACSPVPTDFGDAAGSYGTTVAQDGPRHLITGYDATAHTSTLMIGGQVDDENEGAPGAAATGDDTAGVDDEDVTTVAVAPGATTASATVPLVNTTGAAATLYGWIDASGNGTFQTSEAATVSVPNGATSATLSWTGLPPAVDGSQPVVRIRLTSTALTDNSATVDFDDRSQGPAADGEVEDSLATVAAAVPTSCTDPFVESFGAGTGRAQLPAGQTTYTYAASGAVQDGTYALTPGVDGSYGNWWHTAADHTPGDTNGRLMLVNASVAPGKSFTKTFTGLTAGTQYDFSAWITNANKNGNPILPNVTFQVVDPTSGAVLASTDTGGLPLTPTLVWKQFALKFTATQPTVRLELVNNAPGGNGNDLAIDDIALGAVCEHGDAPDSYGTLLASDGPVHGRGAPHLGATADYEGDGQPTAAADGDDANATDDEDGVTFNPALGYPAPTLRTGTDPISLAVVQNTVRVDASAAGFASVWVDWNQDGDFSDSGERVADAQAVSAGTNDISFAGAAQNPPGIRSYVRVRYSTDASSIHTPTGAAPDGEVEDYRVLIERLVVPSACAPVSAPFYAMTFSTVTEKTTNPDTARYPEVTVVGGVPVDVLAAVAAPGSLTAAGFVTSQDDASWNLSNGSLSMNLTFTFVRSGTTTPIAVNGVWSVNDMDLGESTTYSKSQLAGWTITPGSKVILTETGTTVKFAGGVSGNGEPTQRYQVWFTGQSQLTTTWVGSGFGVDGDGDVAVPPSCDDYGDAPDTFKTVLTSDGPHHTVTPGLRLGAVSEFDGDGQPTPGANGDDLNRTDDEDGVAAPITVTAGQGTTVNVSATNTTAAAATLAGWMDLNDNGTFEAAERAVASVPASSGTASYPLTFPAGLTNADTYARFRLFPGAPADPLPTGAATAGEVEDYPVAGTPPVVSCVTDPALFNTAYDGVAGKTAPGGLDRNWQVALGNATGPASAGRYIPAYVVTPHPAWYPGDFGKAAWISYFANTQQTDNLMDLYFRYTFRIANEVPLDGFALPMEFFADNSVPDVWVNGVSQDPFEAGLPQTTAANAYQYAGFQKANKAGTTLSHGFQHGQNTIVVRVASGAPAAGFMAQMNAQALCTDRGDAPASYGTTGPAGASHGVSGYDASGHTADLMIGSMVDLDLDGVPTPGATGDDTTGTDDEDGVAPLTVTTGSAPNITVTATNEGLVPATLAGWVDLDKSGTFDANERATATVPPLFPGGPVTLTFAAPVTTTQATYARFRLFPGTVADPSATGQAVDGEVEDHPVTTLTPSLQVTKASDATASTGPGDTVHYTVTLTNTGTGAFTAANPARVVDDLTGVLDDATYQADAAATVDGVAVTAPTYAEPRLTWSGPLAAGKSVVVTYSVVLEGGGDGHVRNTAFVPPGGGPNPPTPDCTAPAPTCAPHELELPKLTVAKTANRTQLPAVGQQITYTVTVENTGLGDYTAAHPATFEDDLTAVLDDATLDQADVSATRGTATFTTPRLSWTGTLPAGQSATITYTLTYTGAGDHQLDNSACVPVDEAADPTDACRTVSVPGSGLRHDKSVSPASGTPVQEGQVLTYTLTFENVGVAPATVDTSDDLSGVLDDAQLVGVPTAGAGLTAVVAGDQLEIDGTVPAGQTRTVTYQVEVRPYAAQGDHVLTNVLACEPSEPAGCAPETTSNPVRHLTLTKTSDATVDSAPGDQVTYTVTAHNDGEGDWTALDPATLVDDLTGVLDDAQFDGTATADAGTTSYAAPRLTWSGPLAHGDTVTIEYTVTLTGGGDGEVDNVVWAPPVPGTPGPTPDCSAVGFPCASHGYDLPKLTVDKTSNRTKINADGDQITYTVTVANPGPGDYTAAHPATFSDDLSDVLDDATFDAGSITATSGAAALNGSSLDWSGPLAAGDSATVTYTVTYDSTLGGDFIVDNAACVPEDEALDPTDRCRTVKTPGSGLRERKSVDPASGTPVSEGQVLTYTLTFQNVGAAPATVDNTDDLSGVLDDATLVAGSIQADAPLTAVRNGDAIDIAGTVPVGATLTVTYRVTVKAYADQGDHVITNALGCEPLDVPCVPTTTSNPVRHLKITKTSDATADSKPGDTVSYTVRLENDGAGDYTAASPAALVDDLTGVLDDATFGGTAHASQGPAPTYAAPRLTWTGPLAAGDEVRVTYEVVLKGGGDGHVDNVTWAPVDPGNPGPTPDCATATVPCDTESYDLPKLTVLKDADRTSVTATGQQVTYTVTVTNVGPGDYTTGHPASFSDDLSDVLDDATVDPASITGGATLTGSTLTWSGPLAAGGDHVVTYVVTYRATGDHELDNTACIPAEETTAAGSSCSTTHLPGSGLTHAKTVDPASGTPVRIGQVLTFTLRFTNTGSAPADVDTVDDLSGVLDDAELVAGSVHADPQLTAVVNGTDLEVTGTVLAPATVTYQVRVKPFAQQGDHILENALACEPGDPTPCGPEVTSNPVAHLVLDKSSDRTADSGPGDTVTYTIEATNDGTGDFTAAAPATVVDDLTGVLDDATYGGDATADVGSDPTYAAPRITWSGALAHGETVTITYTVVLKGGGDGVVRNVAWQPEDPGNPGPTPDCAATTAPCDDEEYELPKLTVAKTADRTQLTATGQQVTYQVVLTNPGPGDYTAGHPASFSDDLSDVLDDATIDPASITGGAVLTGTTLTWSGALPAGQSVTVTYVATYRATGDHELSNTACVPVDEALTTADRCDGPPPIPGAQLDHAKSVSPASGTSVRIGQELTYTLTFSNTGTVPADVNTVDDLSDVLDDATLVAGSITDGGGLTGVINGTDLEVTGTVPAGTTRTVTYRVTVKPFAQQGDHVLANALVCEPGDPTPCDPEVTSNPVAHLIIDKSSDRTADSKPGDTVTYTVTATNDGTGDYTGASPATVVDDLTGVLDDATYGNDADADVGADPTYTQPRITWSGALGHGDTVTITYTVVLKGGGDGVVRNVVWEPVDPGDPGPTPDCATAAVPCDTESFDLPKLTVAKSADRADLPATGQQVTYTVRVTNVGPGVYTAGHPATFTDDLSDVLDDATLDGVSATTGTASVTGDTLSWSGVLGTVGAFADITYTFTYRATGDHVLDNTACIPVDEAQTPADACDSVAVPGSGLRHAKSVTPAAGTPVEVGQVLTYTLTFDNTLGQTAATVDTEDDLSEVLDDATFDDASITEGAGLDATRTGSTLAVAGSVPAGATRTVSYQVTVKPFAQQGDHVITNALQCEPGEPRPCAPETVSNPVRHVVLTKVKTAPAAPDTGDVVTYQLTVHNDGTGDWTAADPASVVDDLTDVLDDATWDGTHQASAGSLSYAAPRLTWTGALAHGATVTITYSVTVTNVGDHRLLNTAAVTGCALSECHPPDVDTPLPHVVPSKSSSPASGQAVESGDLVTYTLTWLNDGRAAGVVDSTDDLSGVLDDAVVVTEPTSSSGAVTATRTGTSLRVVGPIGAGDTVTVSYQVRVKPSGQHGDNRLGNVLAQDTPQVDCTATPCTPVPPPVTDHPVGDLDDWKTVDPSSGTAVKQRARLTYTLHFVNTGQAPVTVDRVDDLAGVLDDAILVAGPTASGGLSAAAPVAGRIAVTGTLAVGASATVTYTVEVKRDGQRGDSRLGNYLLDPGQQPPASCSVPMRADGPRADCTDNAVATTRFNLKLAKKVVSSTDVLPGDSVRYRLRVSNRGPDAAPGPIVLRDPLPAGLELVSAKGKRWDCRAKKATDVVACTYDTDLAAGKTAPAVFVVAKVSADASGRVVNVAKVRAVGDTVKSDNKGVAAVQVGAVPELPTTGFRVRLPRW